MINWDFDYALLNRVKQPVTDRLEFFGRIGEVAEVGV